MSARKNNRPQGRFGRRLCWGLIVGGMLLLYPVERQLERMAGPARLIADVLYLPSGDVLRRLSLGHEGLLADVYWTRAVQYFGRQSMAQAKRFDLLGPLLRITTDLDPHLLIAYRYGSIFLAEKAPIGAGQPQEALQLLRRGIVANPDYWRLWEDLGLIYYWDLKEYPAAARVFRIGSERPGALFWMKVLAAASAAAGGEIRTARLIWSGIYQHAEDDTIRKSAAAHLAALEATEQMNQLDALLEKYREKEGKTPSSFHELVTGGYLPRIPLDPSGVPYLIGADGRTSLSPVSKVDVRLVS